MSTKTAWVNGHFDAHVSPFDEGFLLGHGAFETLGVFGGNLPLWDAHLNRLQSAANLLDIPFDIPDDLAAAALELLARERGDDILRLTLTAGVGGRPTWCMTTRRRVSSDGPMHLFISSARRSRADPLAAVKSTSYAFHTLARREAVAAGAADALLLAEGDRILETTTGSVFFKSHGEYHTPRLAGDLLPGVGRRALLLSLESMGALVHESDYTLDDLLGNEALFTTNAVYGPRPAALLPDDPRPLEPLVVEAWKRAVS